MKKGIRRFILLIVTLIFLAAFFFAPLPSVYVLSPGPVGDTKQMVNVKKSLDVYTGTIYVTTVRRRTATLANYVGSLFSPYTDITKEVHRGKIEQQDSRDIQKAFMDNSQQIAIVEAYRLAEKEDNLMMIGTRIMSINRDISQLNKLRVGDIITKINNQNLNDSNTSDSLSQLRRKSNTLTIIRNQNKISIELKKVSSEEIMLHTSSAMVQREPIVSINSKGFGGPSAGAMLTLSIYQQLIGKDLTKGKVIAGTGTIENGGSIGAVGGIPQKVAAAAKAKSDIFFVPEQQAAEGEDFIPNSTEAFATKKIIDSNLHIVPITNMQGIIDYLEKMK